MLLHMCCVISDFSCTFHLPSFLSSSVVPFLYNFYVVISVIAVIVFSFGLHCETATVVFHLLLRHFDMFQIEFFKVHKCFWILNILIIHLCFSQWKVCIRCKIADI